MFKRFRGRAWLALALCVPWLASGEARAHQVWLEQDGSGAALYFGEFGDNLREASPGYLDKIAHVSARVVSKAKSVAVPSERRGNRITIAGRAAKGDSVVAVDDAYPLMESKDGAQVTRKAWTPAARYVPELGPREPALVLDIVPTNADGEFQVVYRGAPLAKAKATLTAVSGWSLSATTDEHGKLRFRLPWKGTYALLVRHEDPTPGRRKTPSGVDEAFDVASYATTLTFQTSAGLPSPPPPPAAPPNQP